MASLIGILMAGVFHAAALFLLTSGLQLVFGVQRIVNLACGSLYALGAYVGISFTTWALPQGLPVPMFPLALLAAGLVVGLIGLPLERLISTIYKRPESFQLLLTFSLILVFQDVLRFFWGANPQQLANVAMHYGSVSLWGAQMPAYNVFVILLAIATAVGLGWFLGRTTLGKMLRATAENREASAAMGVNVRMVYLLVFTLGTTLSTVGGVMVVPTAAVSLQIGVDLVVEAFAVIVIGGLGSMKGAAAGALIVGLIRAAALVLYPEVEVLATYVIVLGILVFKPSGLFGKAAV